MNDAVRLAAEQAVRAFGGRNDGTFNAAGFSKRLCAIAGLKAAIDGELVRALLTGRNDIEVLRGGSHYKIVEGSLRSRQ